MLMKNKIETRFVKIDTRQCAACWQCIPACSKQVIGKVQFLFHRHVVLRNTENCIDCMKCVKTCPAGALSAK